ncbi:hypothetical protein V5E97_11650 [Singulisphaera sp. Ch08]|uniref:Internalin-A n=1 Tax=Singulisphaera sp. Ch08 TaxID=3120278 RepID=A0AAU7CMV3_9BACT
MQPSAIDRQFPTLDPLARILLRPVGLVGRRLCRTRLSLRVLMILVLAIGTGFGWIVRTARDQRDAVAAIRSVNGSVIYDIDWRNATSNPYLSSWSPLQLYDGKIGDHTWLKWVVDRIGIDYFGNVVYARLVERRTSDRSKTDDALMAHIGRLRRLRTLRLDNTQVTEDGLIHLKGLTGLDSLSLAYTRIDDRGLVHLKGLTSLDSLSLAHTRIDDRGLTHLKGLTGLRSLSLDNTRVSDRGLTHLMGLTGLQTLSLDNTRVSDRGLVHLEELNWLGSLYINNTNLTDDGVGELKWALPRVQIVRNQ